MNQAIYEVLLSNLMLESSSAYQDILNLNHKNFKAYYERF